MKLLLLLPAQSVTGAVITIIVLLLIAAMIGYFTAWFYAKSVYTPVIKGLEAEKAELIKQVANLKDDINKLNGKVDNLNEKIGTLEKEIAEKGKEIQTLKKPKKEL
jgi:peptidoglycan hydrolase CwlO-like protein